MKWFKSDSYSLPVVLAISLHAFIVIVGIVTVDFTNDKKPEPKKPVIVNAKVIDISETVIGKREAEERAAKQQALAQAAKQKKEAEQKRKQQAERKALEDKKKQLAQAKQKAAREAAQKAEQEKQRLAEQKRIAEKAEQEKRSAEQKRIAQENERKRQAKAAEEKRKAEAAAESKRREQELLAQAEAERIAEEERKRQEEARRIADEKRKAEEEAAALAAAEKARQDAADEAQMVQSISGLINDRVASSWNRPPNARNGMKAQLRIEFLPNGEILDAHITQSSGDDLFDQRTLDAVFKVGKIEELADIDIVRFERNFRNVDLIFNPQDLRN
ncbi:TonB C-terminal domain-containing protein [Marinomonas sp. C2222]|uniref:TonB C-terminal domain-containing protein n=1 Tax=Marinomonas sargassi TaxID=2984494 RepID=A0ABT2YSW1_9GAMM|nr:TonB C-terminal domain-containing protein [Marinomonas sargassi]MCV2402967.1 TonB C-terminal domain-containing protein [Marinomonas sargassi]